jgi:hypothetical protein
MPNAERGPYMNFDQAKSPYTFDHELNDDKPVGEIDNLSKTRSWRKTLFVQSFALLWLAPILFLLVINIQGYTIGPTIWCPARNCWVDFYNADTEAVQRQLRDYNHDDHNVLGGLQLVAKALEVWFETIAVYLVYLVTMDIAGLESGLPIGFLMRPFEFSRAPSLFDKLLWQSGPSFLGAKTKKSKAYRTRIYLYILMTIALCALCNLMGPSAAVLVLPALQWIDTDKVGNTQFASINGAQPPRSDTWLWSAATAANLSCLSSTARPGQYSCFQSSFGLALDSWLSSYMSFGGSGLTQQYALSFSINYTLSSSSASAQTYQADNTAYWAPNRQTVSDLNTDLTAVALVKSGADGDIYRKANVSLEPFESFAAYNGSLQLSLQRDGPILGALISEWIGINNTNSWTTIISPDLQVRCYESYSVEFLTHVSDATTYTKCVRIGSGWSSVNKAADFTILGAYDYNQQTVGPNVTVNIFSSDKAAFFEGGRFPEWFSSACRVNGTLPSGTDCDWNRIFQIDPSSPIANRSSNVNTIEMHMQDGVSSAILAADFTAFLGFTTYALDPSPLSNPSGLVTTNNIVQSAPDPLVIDPAWILAAWSSNNGSARAPDRLSSKVLQQTMSALLTEDPSDNDSLTQALMVLLPIAQSLSIVDYNTEPLTQRSSASAGAASDNEHPPLLRSARMYVWAYGVNTRTAVLGVVVMTLGVLVTLLQFGLSMGNRRPFHSTTKLIVAALEHLPRDEFREKEQDEKAAARTRFHIRDNNHTAGKLTFRHTGAI